MKCALSLVIILCISYQCMGQVLPADGKELFCNKNEILCKEDTTCNIMPWPKELADYNGRKIIRGQLVYSDTMKVPTPLDTIIQYYLSQSRNRIARKFINTKLGRPLDSVIIDSTKFTSCLCNENIWLIESDLLIEIENGVAESAATRNSKEGGTLSPNYLIEPTDDFVPKSFYARLDAKDSTEAEGYFNTSTDTSTIKVAFLDTGVRPNLLPNNTLKKRIRSPLVCDLNLNYTAGWNFIDGNDSIEDDNGHGHVVYAAYDNALTKCNFIPNHELLIVKTLNQCGYGTSFTNACGLYFAKREEVDYINCSWGYEGKDIQIERAIVKATKAGIKIICSAGNKGENINGANMMEHFPSGFSVFDDFSDNLSDSDRQLVNASVFEIAGLCLTPVGEIGNQQAERWHKSNYRQARMFSEPAMKYQYLVLPDYNECNLSGTSFSAPQFTGAMVRGYGKESVNKAELTGNECRSHRSLQASLSTKLCNENITLPSNKE